MKKLYFKFGKFVACYALAITTLSMNRGCWLLAYQPELPEAAKKLRKF